MFESKKGKKTNERSSPGDAAPGISRFPTRLARASGRKAELDTVAAVAGTPAVLAGREAARPGQADRRHGYRLRRGMNPVLPKVRRGGAVAAHNVGNLSHPMSDFLARIKSDPAVRTEFANPGTQGFSISYVK